MDASDVRQASRAVWEAMARGWEERHTYFEVAARPVTETMLDHGRPQPGQTVLDLAAGTGVVGLAAASHIGPDGRAIVSDFVPEMVEVARRNAQMLGMDNVDCRVLDAEDLALDDDVVDVVLCRWGYMLMPDAEAALAESRRVLRSGGRLACAVFAGPNENPWAALPMQVLVERGHVSPPQPGTPGTLALGDHGQLDALLTGAGFGAVDIEEVAFSWPFGDGDDYWRFLTEASGAVAITIEGLAEDERQRVREDLLARLGPYETTEGIELPAVAVVAAAG